MAVATLPSWILRFPDRASTSLNPDGPNFVDHTPLFSRPRPLPPPPILIDTGSAHKPLCFGTLRPSTPDSFFVTEEFSVSLISLIEDPGILSQLLQHLDWPDWFALLNTCSDCRQLFHSPVLKDTILAHYVPGYRACLRNRDLRRYQDVHVTLHDLNLLLLSQRLPLHRYPMHALSALSALLSDREQLEMSAKLAALALAHSRFVLLIQSLVHSSTSPLPPEPKEARSRPRLSESGIRELTFPAPLSFHNTHPDRSNHAKSLSSVSASVKPTRPSLDSLSSSSSKGRRLSIFGRNGKVPPPPAYVPHTLKLYSGSWRRSLQRSATASDDEWPKLRSKLLPQPSNTFLSSDLSSESSFTTPSPATHNSMIDIQPITEIGCTSPHDLKMATFRSRAPILRVFVPCSELSEDSIPECEEQLMFSGLWQHLSTGDIICNLGYVPPAQKEDGSSDGDLPGQSATRTWLIYNGEGLAPFSPLEPPPLEEPLSLPSPFYYMHLLPLFVNPTYILSLPPCDNVPELTLNHISVDVPSPHSPSGHALVKKYMWTARVWRREEGLGHGWQGEWILEGEGTKEGRQTLLHSLNRDAAVHRHWELVREKSGGGLLWFKLLSSFY